MTEYKHPIFSAAAEFLTYLASTKEVQSRHRLAETIDYWQHNKAYRNGEQVRFSGRVWQAQEWNINRQPDEAEPTPWADIKAC